MSLTVVWGIEPLGLDRANGPTVDGWCKMLEQPGFRRTLLIGSSGGIGRALADVLQGTDLTTLSRSETGLDLLDEASLQSAVRRLHGTYDLIFDATGGLSIDGSTPEKALSQISPAQFAAQFALNATGPALLLKHFGPLMPREGRAVFATLSARVGSIGDNRLGGWVSYRASKAALNQIVRTAAVELARRNPQSIVVALHPGTVRTPLTERYLARHPAVPPAEAAANLVNVVSALGPEHSGGFYDYGQRQIPW
ncbi:MAG: SDR family NAD(P)-dependent oxidoreductase [Pseudomonadota bacterium]